MPAKRKLTDEEIAQIRDWYREKMTRREIAAKYQVTVRTIARICTDPAYRAAHEEVTEAEFQRLVSM